jgi:hypothetical protein
MKADSPIELIGDLPVLERLVNVSSAYYDRIREQKELARERLRTGSWELHDLHWKIETLMDRLDEYTDPDGYYWKYDIVDNSRSGIIVACKYFGQNEFGYKVYTPGSKHVTKREPNTPEPFYLPINASVQTNYMSPYSSDS